MTPPKYNFKSTITEHTFNYIKAHPYVTKMDAVSALIKDGCNPASTSSMIAHMIRVRLISMDNLGKLTAIAKEFKPLQATSTKGHKHVNIVTKPVQMEPMVTVANSPAVEAYVNSEVAKAERVESLLNTINVTEARELYLALKTMFGGS